VGDAIIVQGSGPLFPPNVCVCINILLNTLPPSLPTPSHPHSKCVWEISLSNVCVYACVCTASLHDL
jgi:hypothetical protein